MLITMSECRICLATRKNSQSIFEPSDRNISTTYADMITYVASVKILRDDGITDQICLPCRKKLKDLYDFKLLIQRSNTSLHQKVKSPLKTIHFNDIAEIKFEVKLTQTDDKYFIKEYEDIKMNLQKHKDTFCYKGTTIKKIVSNITNEEIHNEPVSIDDFLKTIKEEPDGYYDPDFDAGAYNGDSTDNDEYLPPITNKKKKTKHKKNKKAKRLYTKENETGDEQAYNRVCIKPVILNDLRVQKTLGPKKFGPQNKKSYTNKKPTVCPYCGKLTGSIKSHLLVHSEPKYKCNQCDKKYYTERKLNSHMETHSNIKPFKCDQCVASFHTIANLKSHLESHLDVRKFVCDVCSKSYKRVSQLPRLEQPFNSGKIHQLARHARTHNFANKTHKCEQCNMSFFSSYGLRHHMRVHTGERPYKCELCSQPYSYKHDFNRHCLKKHGIFLKRRYVNVMNEEVLARERLIMKELMLRAHGLKEGDENPFEGPQGALAYEQAIKTFRANPLTLTLQH